MKNVLSLIPIDEFVLFMREMFCLLQSTQVKMSANFADEISEGWLASYYVCADILLMGLASCLDG